MTSTLAITDNEWPLCRTLPFPDPNAIAIPREKYISALPPQNLESSSSTLNYLVKGTDTITIGDQEKWALIKKVLTFARVSGQSITESAWGFPSTESLVARNPLEELREITASGTQTEFTKAVANIDTWQSPLQMVEAIKMALQMGCYSIAAKLASEGTELFTEDDRLKEYARVLAPPKVVKTGIPPVKGLGDSMRWLRKHRSEYRGQWVVVKSGELLAHSNVRSELTEILESLPTRENVVVTKVPSFDIPF
jgi:hypothetical protein